MWKPWKIALGAAGAVLGIGVVGAAGLLLAWRGHAKAQLEAAASDALGMQVSIGGRPVLQFFPSLGLRLEDVRIHSRGTELAAARQARLGVELVSLLRRQVRITLIELNHATISVERGRDGKFNFEAPGRAGGALPDSTDVSLTDLTFEYANRQAGTSVHAGPCEVQAQHLRFSDRDGEHPMKGFGVSATVSCGQIKTRDLPMSDVRFALEADKGVLATRKLTMRAFGGQGSAEVRADFSGPVPSYRVHGLLSKFRIDEFAKNFSQKSIGHGALDFSTELTMTGTSAEEMIRSSAGEASLHGTGLTLDIGDLDRELSNYKATQRFSLIDLGAFFFAGPIGLALTKGYDYAKVMDSTGGSSRILTLVSEWHIERGVAQAKDVAMTTQANRVALKGALDFVTATYQDVTVAVVGPQGCVQVQQKVRGPFNHPEVEKPNVVASLAGPALHLLKKARHALGGHCEVFYAGSLPPPPQ
ncbi:MAG: AsmA family protein [Steroidobacterales bacterium]